MPARSGDPSRQRFLLKFAVGFLAVMAIMILILPGPIPKPVRLLVAGTDLAAAAAIWLLGRQKLNS